MTLYIPTSQSDSVIDVSHWQRKPNWQDVKAKNPGIKGVIAKATQGIHVDPSWDWNAKEILEAGFLFGAYHFATGLFAEPQVDEFFRIVNPQLGTLVAIDWEPAGQSSLAIVEKMVQLFHERLDRFPVIYMGRDQILAPNYILSKCELWLPEYGTKPICPPGFDKWRLHQHTDGSLGDKTGPIIGIGPCDRSYYDETRGAIEGWWGR